MKTIRSFVPPATLMLSAVLVLGGCAVAPEPQPAEVVEEQAVGDKNPLITEPKTVVLPPGSTAQGVVVAALVLSAGDIDRALLEGQVTPSEVKYASLAIDEGTLNGWRELAEAESTE